MSDRSPKRNGCLFEMERNGGPFCRSEEDRPRTVPEYVPSERSRTGNIGIRYSCAFDFRQNQVAETGAKMQCEGSRFTGNPCTTLRKDTSTDGLRGWLSSCARIRLYRHLSPDWRVRSAMRDRVHSSGIPHRLWFSSVRQSKNSRRCSGCGRDLRCHSREPGFEFSKVEP